MSSEPSYPALLFGRALPLAAIVGLAVANGFILSPLYDFFSFYVSVFTRRTMFADPNLRLYGPSLMITLLTLMVAGIPAALYERIRGHRQSTPVSLGIWLLATAALSAPVLLWYFGPK